MIPYYEGQGLRLYHCDVRAGLAALPSDSVHCCVTSPPYFGLRSYSTAPQVWPGDTAPCEGEHDWGDLLPGSNRGGSGTPTNKNNRGEGYGRADPKGRYCRLCGAWCGELGSEPTPDLFVRHLVGIFEEVRRVLRGDGTCWVNISGSFAGAVARPQNGGAGNEHGQQKRVKTPDRAIGYKPKDWLPIPWLLGIALQHAGWYLRGPIYWWKKSPMPESVTDRPTQAVEYILLLSKRPNYYYDAQAVAEPSVSDHPSGNGYKREARLSYSDGDGARGGETPWQPQPTRNMRNFWLLGPDPYPFEHFATFPHEIPRRAILAGTSERGCCPRCAAPWKRILSKARGGTIGKSWQDHSDDMGKGNAKPTGAEMYRTYTPPQTLDWKPSCTLDWKPSCTCDAGPAIPCTALDPFCGSGTTLDVARLQRRRGIGLELSEDYCKLAIRRFGEKPVLDFRAENSA